MKLFKRIFTFAAMAIIGVITLASCQFTVEGKKVQIDMDARVYVGQTYELVAKNEKGEILSDVEWSIVLGDNAVEYAVIANGELTPVQAGIFTVEVKYQDATDQKQFSAIDPLTWSIEYNGVSETEAEVLFKTYNEFDGEKALSEPSRLGYSFAGWYDNDELEGSPVTSVQGFKNEGKDLELYAKWDLITFDLSFEVNGGVVENLPTSYSIEDLVASLPEATKEHYTFLGWFTEEGVKVESITVENVGVTKLVAQYEAVKYNISYELDGGVNSESNASTYTVEDALELTPATKSGYNFLGWELNGEIVTSIPAGTTGNFTLVAKWEVVVYELSFEVNGGVVENLPTSYSIEDLVASLPEATKEHYTFLGWFTEEGVKVESITVENVGVTKLVAQYEAVKYNISYELDGGVNSESNASTYTVEDTLELTPATKSGYNFLGWELNGEIITSIVKGTTGDLVLTATWEKSSILVDGAEYQTLAEAVAAAKDNAVIVVPAGEYELKSVTISKNITIEGPNVGVHGNAERQSEAIIKMDSVTISASVTIDGVKLVGTGYLGNTAFFGGAKLSTFVLKNSVVSSYKNVFTTNENHDASIEAIVTFENNSFDDLGQFFVWIKSNVHAAGYKSFNLLNNYTVAGSKYAGVVAENGMISIRCTDNTTFQLNVIGNYLVNPTSNSYIRLNSGVANIKYNTFVNVSLYNAASSTAKLVYDENLYLDANSNVLTSAPDAVAKNGGVADTAVLANEEECAKKAAVWIENFHSNVEYKINYELNSGILPENAPTSYVASDLPLALPVPTLEGKVFIGWYDNPEFTGSKISNIAFGSTKEYTLYARFGEEWELNAIYVGANKEYETIADALAAAKENAYIVVDAGTYDEDVNLTTNGITIKGANAGIAYDGARSTETSIKSITIKGDNITVDGVNLTATQAIDVKGGNNITIQNSVMGGTPTANTQQVILISGDVNGFYLYDSKVLENNSGLSYTHYRAILGNGTITNSVIKGNHFEQAAATTVYIDGIKLTRIAGNITIEENTFNWPGDNWTVYLGTSFVAYNTIVNFNYNLFEGEQPQSGASVINTDSTTTVNIIGNVLNNVKGNILQVRGSSSSDRKTPVCVNISHNAFNGTSSKISIQCGLDNLVMDSNYFFKDVAWSANDAANVTNNATDAESATSSIVKYEVAFELNGGTVIGTLPTEYFANGKLNLTCATPTKDAYTFLGWYDNPEFTGDPIQILGSQGSDVTLYAKFELIPVYNVTYELDGGSAEGLVSSDFVNTEIKLPTPEKFGFVFLGWSFEKGSTEYINSFVLTEDTTVYANWLEAEIYNVTYELNGGSVRYTSRDDMILDFLDDYNEFGGYSYTSPSQVPSGAWSNIDFHTFFNATLSDGTVVREKWLWLAEYLYELSVRDLASNNCNVLGLRDLINKGTISGDDTYGISYAFRAFIVGTTVRPNTGYTSVDFSVYTNANGFWEKLNAAEPTEYEYYGTITLPIPGYSVYQFAGWYDNPEFTGDPITEINSACTLYAKFIESAPVESVTITNKVTEIKRYETLQLEWVLNPENPTVSNVRFSSSDESVATVDDKGLVTAVSNGLVTIKIISDSETQASDEFVLDVYSPDHFEISYETVSYVSAGKTIKLNADYVKRDGSKVNLLFASQNLDIATVDALGNVTGVKEGLATIRVQLEDDATSYFDFVVTVLPESLSDAQQYVVDQHESNVFTKYNLGIGAGTPAYYEDIFGSISKVLYNHEFSVNNEYLAKGDASGRYYTLQSLEFITVHYTGNMSKGADASANAAYFVGDNASVSIHYTTGNDGVYSALSHQYGAWHAGDSGSVKHVGHFEWIPTGLEYDGTELLDVVFTASDDFYYEINGKKTTIKLPSTYKYETSSGTIRDTDHIYNADGTISSNTGYGQTAFTNRTPESFFNDQDFAVKVIDGEYYMGKTWWSYGQVYEGRICSNGGNYNSIGIESCVDLESDLWLTWQYTAQLVANLLDTYGLGLERVKGHHFFDGKDCPQPLLENDLEIWWEFIDLVAAELELLQEFKDCQFNLEVDSASTNFVSENGRITSQPEFSQVVTYTVEIVNGDKTETITLASAVNGIYTK